MVKHFPVVEHPKTVQVVTRVHLQYADPLGTRIVLLSLTIVKAPRVTSHVGLRYISALTREPYCPK